MAIRHLAQTGYRAVILVSATSCCNSDWKINSVNCNIGALPCLSGGMSPCVVDSLSTGTDKFQGYCTSAHYRCSPYPSQSHLPSSKTPHSQTACVQQRITNMASLLTQPMLSRQHSIHSSSAAASKARYRALPNVPLPEPTQSWGEYLRNPRVATLAVLLMAFTAYAY
jgi:hypothetical protein